MKEEGIKPPSGRVIPSQSTRLRILHSLVCGSVALTAVTLRAASPDDPSCQAILDATAKMEHTDNHQRITIGQNGQETEEGESIQVGNTSYIKIDNEWHTSPLSPKDSAAQRQENIRNAKVFTCQYERDETVNGEPAAVYKTHQESDEVKADAELCSRRDRPGRNGVTGKSTPMFFHPDRDGDTGFCPMPT